MLKTKTIMAKVNIYLTFNGNCYEAFTFYKAAFGGEFPYVGKYKEMPPLPDGTTFTDEAGERIMHMSLPISSETILAGSDTGGKWAAHYKQGNNFSVSISAETKERADQLFNDLSTNGKVTMPLGKTFWGDYFGSFTDQFGINWMVSYNENA